MITMEEWRDQLNTDEATAREIAYFIAQLDAQARLGELAIVPLSNLWKDAPKALEKALGIRVKELIVCRVYQYLSTLRDREVHRASGGNLKYAVEGCENLADLLPFANVAFPVELFGEFRYLFGKIMGDRITTAMKLALQPVFNEKTAHMVIAGFETAVERYVGLLLTKHKKEAAAVLPLIDLFCKGNWPVSYFLEQERFLILVA